MIIVMREVNLSGIDLDLIPVLDALIRRRNVTRAAEEVGLSQPAMSRALQRLRALFKDPLLVRAAGGLVTTPKADQLAPRVTRALQDLRLLFHEEVFDPAHVRREIRMIGTDGLAVQFVPALMARLQEDAPGLSVRLMSFGPDIIARMDRGEADFVFALGSTQLPPGAQSEAIGRDRLVLVTRRGHPHGSGPWTLADYCRYRHARVSIFGDGLSDVDTALAAAGLRRDIALTVPHFAGALAAVGASDMITTLSEKLARRLADSFGLELHDAPLPETGMTITLVWSAVRSADPVLVWFRGVVRDTAAVLFDPPS